MARTKGSMSVSANFEVKAAAPLDARYYVPTLADLTASSSWITGGLAYVYVGMQVYVLSEHKLYMLTASDFTTMNNWTEIAAGGNILTYKGDVTTYSALPSSGLSVGDTYYVTDEQANYYYNGITWVQLGSPDKSSYIWISQSNLGILNAAVNVALTSIKRSDNATISATADDMLIGKTIIADPTGIIGVVIGLNGTTDAIVKTITVDTKSDGVHLANTTLDNTIGNTTILTGMTISNLVLNETLVYDTAGTVAVITAENATTGDLTATTITKVQDKLGDAFISSSALTKTIGETTTISISSISGMAAADIVLNNTIVADAHGTLGVIINKNTNDVVIKTLTIDTKSDGIYKTSETLDITVSNIKTIDIANIIGITASDIVLNETLIFDNAGTVARVNSINTTNNTLDVETITVAGNANAGKLKAVLTSSQKVGGVNIGDSFATGTDFETLFRAILDPVIKPTFTNPSATLSVGGSTLLESGSSVSKTFTAVFNRGTINPAYTTSGYRSGEATGYSLNGGSSQLTNTWTETVSSGNKTFVAAVSYAAGEQPVDSAGNNYDAPYPAGSVNSNTITFEFVDALWANTSNITTIAKLSLVSKSAKSKEFSFPAQTVANPEVFDVPASWTITKVEVYNDLSGKYQDVSSEFTTSSTSHNNAAGTAINYVRYTDNRGYSAGSRKIKITWS